MLSLASYSDVHCAYPNGINHTTTLNKVLKYQRKSLILSVFEHSSDEDIRSKSENEVSISEDDEEVIFRQIEFVDS